MEENFITSILRKFEKVGLKTAKCSFVISRLEMRIELHTFAFL